MCIFNRCCRINNNGNQNLMPSNFNNGCNQTVVNGNNCNNLGYFSQWDNNFCNNLRMVNQCNRTSHPIVVGTINTCCNMCCRNNMLYNPYTNVLFLNCRCGYNSCGNNCD